MSFTRSTSFLQDSLRIWPGLSSRPSWTDSSYVRTFFMSIHNHARDDDLAHGAIADLKTSAQHLVDSRDDLGLSRWGSLQAAEKLLKHFLRSKGRQFPKTHNLSRLADIAARIGLVLSTDL